MTTAATIEPRMTHPAMLLPDALSAMQALSKSTKRSGLPIETTHLVHLRASQINGCAWCVEMHSRELAESGAPPERVYGVAAWREAPYFTEAERVALELTEALTRIADRGDPVSDELFERAAEQFDETALAALLVEIGAINVWNRLNVAVRVPAGMQP
jgi:AhpD family alkylhydroperoxidase